MSLKRIVSKPQGMNCREDWSIKMKDVVPNDFKFTKPRDLSGDGTLFNASIEFQSKSLLYQSSAYEVKPYNIDQQYNYIRLTLRTPEERTVFEYWDQAMRDLKDKVYAETPFDGINAEYKPLLNSWESEKGSGHNVKIPLNVNRNTDILSLSVTKKQLDNDSSDKFINDITAPTSVENFAQMITTSENNGQESQDGAKMYVIFTMTLTIRENEYKLSPKARAVRLSPSEFNKTDKDKSIKTKKVDNKFTFEKIESKKSNVKFNGRALFWKTSKDTFQASVTDDTKVVICCGKENYPLQGSDDISEYILPTTVFEHIQLDKDKMDQDGNYPISLLKIQFNPLDMYDDCTDSDNDIILE